MAFFSKLRNKLRKSSSKIEEGLEAIVNEGGTQEDIDGAAPEPASEPTPDLAPSPGAETLVLGAADAVPDRMPAPPAPLADDDRPAGIDPAPVVTQEPLPDLPAPSDPCPAPEPTPVPPAEPEPVPHPEPLPEPEPTPEPEPEPQPAPEPGPAPTPEPLPGPAPTEQPPAPAWTPEEPPTEIPPSGPAELPTPSVPIETLTGLDKNERGPDMPRKGLLGRMLGRTDPKPDTRAEPRAPAAFAPDDLSAPTSADAGPASLPEQSASVEPASPAPLSIERAEGPLDAIKASAGMQETGADQRGGLLSRVLGGGKRTVIRRELDDDMLESLEELLITADMGVDTAMRVTANMAEGRFGKRLSVDEIKDILAHEIAQIMEPVARPMPLYPRKPQVVLVVGVNGSGKTTTIGKLASQFRDAGKSVIIAAGDTFRAAAVEQLQVWGDRAGVPVMTAPEGSDPASLAFDAMARAEAEGTDLLMIDTAGRLQNRADLMAELEKIVRVIRKRDESAPHNTLLVLDATTGQNALSQVETFQKMSDVSGLVMTKLDGTAKGGVLVALADRFGLPIHAIGVGERIEDLAPFDPEDFARALAGIDA
ncbi:signal recognition particle-docking protein FtsY [Rhodovulum bhavnagarense]|uniref:Signal recognition particle receptor FtsY n=1 Tax=Rhodovulum bhavnagarense TaxID=992286 RepID=A0A4R2RH86_9RHOB|nr:signal recognition particle-docking protein FtsY [Rhodovulum bhavnagarense]TCP62343.1 signal recognition particle-docking protein FtsY [Rhodovulum bhavnagarense]